MQLTKEDIEEFESIGLQLAIDPHGYIFYMTIENKDLVPSLTRPGTIIGFTLTKELYKKYILFLQHKLEEQEKLEKELNNANN